ncbi:MAG TPA: polynucleotide adenylyltransferase PcnB [Planctomycetota bacterium]|nr:polynucleotide adenylyltransferase PcnB [Planctomycetota bacterium]
MRRTVSLRGRRRRPRPEAAEAAPENEIAAPATVAPPTPEELRRQAAVQERIQDLCPEAPRVIGRLSRFGFRTYLCGGSVRDLLLGLRPKDFDLATDATPRQVKRTFRNSRIIGRRFRLVQITFPDKILEVSTFRGAGEPAGEGADLLIVQDNTFGTPEEDAVRRDFTVNGLYYDLEAGRVIDFVGGLRDLERRVIETIGDPWVRFREDPVRMLRAVKFASRLGFRLADDVYQSILDCRDELKKAAPARVYEEIIRLTNMGGACDALRLLYRTGLLAVILPELAAALDAFAKREDPEAWTAYWEMLRGLDAATRAGEVPSNARLLAFALWPLFETEIETGQPASTPDEPEDGLAPIAGRLRMSRRDAYLVRQIMYAQRRFSSKTKGRRRKGSPQQLSQRDWFDDAWFFFTLRARAFGRDDEVAAYESSRRAREPGAGGDAA